MRIRFLLGPAGSGKTFRCLTEIRDALAASPDGPPLILLAPKQATFQLERQLLSDPAVPGYTRLQILSFERLAEFVLAEFGAGSDELLDEEGRVMALRALLGRHRSKLKIFHATARLPGFAQQLSQLLREFQRQQISPQQLVDLAQRLENQPALANKLHDVAFLLDAYLDWLRTHQLQDANCLLDVAASVLRETVASGKTPLHVGGVWLDGFAEMTPQELDLLTAFLQISERATLAFCLDEGALEGSWLSGWAVVAQSFRQCRDRIAALPGSDVVVEILERDSERSRFSDSPILEQLEKSWINPDINPQSAIRNPQSAIGLAVCASPETEAVFVAREIRRFVRAGGRFREAAVLVRRLDDYHDVLCRVFRRYEIPFFLDRREPVTHHPLAELTRYALRLAVREWQHDDWFAALKTGLVTDDETAIDRLENEALAHGWEGDDWFEPLKIPGQPELEASVHQWLQKVLPPFVAWKNALASFQGRPTGSQLAQAIRRFWEDTDIDRTLEQWSDRSPADAADAAPVHLTVLDQMHAWLDSVELAFRDDALSLGEWLPVLEAGLVNLTIGVIPPALDQVLIGAIDRSRNPELKLALLPGWNETVFPAVSVSKPLLTEPERELLAGQNVRLGPGRLQQIGHERYYAYIACSRARQRVVITCSTQNADGQPLNPSPFFERVKQLTGVVEESFSGAKDWRETEHAEELTASVLRAAADGETGTALQRIGEWPAFAPRVKQWREIEAAARVSSLAPSSVEKIYGRELHSSVSGLEDFAACVFKFFAARGLRLQERKEFQFDARDKGSLQHDVLREFQSRLQKSGKRWRDLQPAEARELVMNIGRELLPEYGGGRFHSGGAARFTGEFLIERLGRLVATLVGWMPQYDFDPEVAEIGFGPAEILPAWKIDLPGGRALLLRGRIDRVDICRTKDRGALAVVMDYKSSARALNRVKLHHGLELQLLSYLGVLRHLANPEKFFGVTALSPAGVFYVPLNGGGGGRSTGTRAEVLGGGDAARRGAYQHSGRFLADALEHFDNRGEARGDQFRFSRNNDGGLRAGGSDPLAAAEFEALRVKVEEHLRDYGRRIFEGEADVSPFRCGQELACDRCDFRSVCRFDPWTQTFRELRPPPRVSKEQPAKSGSGSRGAT